MRKNTFIALTAVFALTFGTSVYAYWTQELKFDTHIPIVYSVEIKEPEEETLINDLEDGVVDDIGEGMIGTMPSQEDLDDLPLEESGKSNESVSASQGLSQHGEEHTTALPTVKETVAIEQTQIETVPSAPQTSQEHVDATQTPAPNTPANDALEQGAGGESR